jgi:putative transposase
MKYNSKNRKKYYLLIHLVLVTKYRKPLLNNHNIDLSIKRIMSEISNKYDFDIELMETDRNHIHILINYPPTITISSIVRCLKQQSCFNIWLEYGSYLSKHYWKERTFWSDSYFVTSVGSVDEEKVREYIDNQKNN